MSSALVLMAVFTGAAIVLLVFGLHLLFAGLRLALWVVTTKAGWITAGVLAVIYLAVRYS